MIKNRCITVICAIGCCLSVGAQNIGWALKPEYDAISNYSEGIATVAKNGKWGYVSDGGTKILAPEYDAAYPFSEGRGVLASKDGTLVAVVDQTGKLTPIREKLRIDSRFAAFSDGLLLVNKNRKWGYINKDGAQAIDCKYDVAQPFSEGLAAAVLDSRQCYCWYYMDTNGKAVFHLSDLKKDIYWAMGFYEGKALVLHSKGALFVNRSGQEQKETLPQITPPEAADDYFKPTLACKEGILTFDAKCRALSFIGKNNKETKFISAPSESDSRQELPIMINGTAPAPEDIRWLTPSAAVVKVNNSKYGMLIVYDAPVLTFSFPSDTLTSVFGNPAVVNLNIRNTSPQKSDQIDIKVNGKTFQATALPEGGMASVPLSFDKTTDDEMERKDLSITAYEEGLQIGESKKTIYIKNVPALSIYVPTSKITLPIGQNVYSVKVQVKNLSDVPANNVVVTIDQQMQILSNLNGEETETVQFTFPAPKESGSRMLYISAKSPNTPAVTANVRVTIETPLPPPPTF
ncbi:MAG: WG repeat-containing protein [Candidatus Azobacteroides sp.]|nr:WG repeat-containing protein [Candidatus Azobacteroides sp.]